MNPLKLFNAVLERIEPRYEKNWSSKRPLIFPFILTSSTLHQFSRELQDLMKRVLAPLRRIVSRELVEFQPDSRVRHFIYSLRDTLECGHESESYLFDGLRDMLNAYTESPLVRARHHRCQPCAALTQTKKPVQSVATAEKVAGAA